MRPPAQKAKQGEKTTDPDLDVHPRRMLNRYEVIAEIARGGMGTVLLARLVAAGGFERLMAIKLMHEHLANEEAFVTMLLDEARTAANIHHPNAVGIVDISESPLGYYLVMNYVEGFTLAQLASHPDITDEERIRLGLRVAIDGIQGLHAAHTTKNARGEKLNIVHRDVSPQNILVGLDGVGRIVDFGIALAASRVTASRPGMLKGKPSYMAPEQARGQACSPQADVFAAGIIVWELLCGRRLFQAELDVATLIMVMQGDIPTPSDLFPDFGEEIDRVVLKALTRDLDFRYKDARQFATELEEVLTKKGMLATTHEVADQIAELFAEEIEKKQASIKRHLSTSTGDNKPLLPGQLGLIPKLSDDGPAARSVASEDSQSGVRARGEEFDPTAVKVRGSGSTVAIQGDIVFDKAALEKGLHSASIPPPALKKKSSGAGFRIGLTVALVAVGALGIYMLFRESPEPPTAREEPVIAEPVLEEPVIAEPVIAEPVIAEPVIEEPVIEEPVVTAPPTTAVRTPRVTPATRPTPRVTPDRPPPVRPTQPPPTGTSRPTLEENPYQ